MFLLKITYFWKKSQYPKFWLHKQNDNNISDYIKRLPLNYKCWDWSQRQICFETFK
jgi:hypothetical protein